MPIEELTLLCNRAISLAEDLCLDAARSVLEQAEGRLRGHDHRCKGLVEAAWCRFFDLSGDRRAAASHGRQAIRLLENYGSEDEAAAALIYMGAALSRRGEYLGSLNLFNRAVTLLRGSSDHRLTVMARWGLGSTLALLERYHEARGSLLAAEARSHSLPSLVQRGRLQKSAGLACLHCGDLARAEPLLSRALRAFEAAGRVELLADVCNSIGTLRLFAGDRDAARESYRRAIRLLQGRPCPALAEAYYELAYWELSGSGAVPGSAARAADHALCALRVARRLGSDVEVARSALALGQALVALEKPEAAIPPLQRASALFRRRSLTLSAVVAEDMLKWAESRSQGSRRSPPSPGLH
ncbi:MAG: hypothetical protein K6T75_07500 [Acetobacteraceae bacterium]|nr:hypothetical protein [Acetobacteraceae bacterium]